MTALLEQAIKAVQQLGEAEQDSMAVAILAEVHASDKGWDARLARSAASIDAMAREAIAEHQRGESQPMEALRVTVD